VQEIEAQINQAWATLEPLVEQYNLVHSQLQQNQAKSAELEKQMRPLATQVDLVRTKVGSISAELYRDGPGSKLELLLSQGDAGSFADGLTTLDQLAHRQTETVADAASMVARYNAEKQPLDQLIGVESQQDADLAAKKNTIQAQMDSLQKLRLQAYGASGMSGAATKPVACPYDLTVGPGAKAAKVACSEIGKPYVWATAGPRTFDCSGLTLYAWAAAGVTLGHYTGWQWTEGKPVTRDQLQPGDLVFFFSDQHHVGMYVGGGWMVNAPTGGDVVRMAKIDGNPYLPVSGYRRPGA
jgi:cell wall-associated NlpC family hydrolase